MDERDCSHKERVWPVSALTELKLNRSLSWLLTKSLLFSKRSRSDLQAEANPSLVTGDLATIAFALPLGLALRWNNLSTGVNLVLLI